MEGRIYFTPAPEEGTGDPDPLNRSWGLNWEVTLRDGRRYGDYFRSSEPVAADPLLLGIVDGLFAQAIQVVAQLHRDGCDLAPITIEYYDTLITKELAGV